MGKRRKLVTSPYFKTSHYFHPKAPLKGSLAPILGVAPHTLLLGTQASDNALAEVQAFATNENAFWHIIGDALGFRRGFHVKREEAVPTIRRHLLHPPDAACSYEEATRRLREAGFAVWDIVAQEAASYGCTRHSERIGSLDSDIRNPHFNDVRALCELYPSIRRICFATGTGSARIFLKAWKQAVFCKWVHGRRHTAHHDAEDCLREVSDGYPLALCGVGCEAVGSAIELVVMESVSPASIPLVAARSLSKRIAAYTAEGRLDLVVAGAPRASSYAWKRAQWLAYAFPQDVLHPAAKTVVPFGSRRSDLEPSDTEDFGDESDCDLSSQTTTYC